MTSTDHALPIGADDVYVVATRAAAVRSRFLPALELVPNLGQIFVLSYGGHLVLDGKISVGTLVMFNFYVIVLVNPLRMLGQIIAQAERALVAADLGILTLAPTAASLEELFFRMTEGGESNVAAPAALERHEPVQALDEVRA